MEGLAIRKTWRAALILGLVVAGFIVVYLALEHFVQGATSGHKQESGIAGDLVLPTQTVAHGLTCSSDGTVRGIWFDKLIRNLGGTVEEIKFDGNDGAFNTYDLVTLNGKRIVVTFDKVDAPVGPADVDARINAAGGTFAGDDVELVNDKTLAILQVAYPTAHLDKQLSFDWDKNLCSWSLALQ